MSIRCLWENKLSFFLSFLLPFRLCMCDSGSITVFNMVGLHKTSHNLNGCNLLFFTDQCVPKCWFLDDESFEGRFPWIKYRAWREVSYCPAVCARRSRRDTSFLGRILKGTYSIFKGTYHPRDTSSKINCSRISRSKAHPHFIHKCVAQIRPVLHASSSLFAF